MINFRLKSNVGSVRFKSVMGGYDVECVVDPTSDTKGACVLDGVKSRKGLPRRDRVGVVTKGCRRDKRLSETKEVSGRGQNRRFPVPGIVTKKKGTNSGFYGTLFMDSE